MSEATETRRHPGRRKQAPDKIVAKHKRLIQEAERKRRAKEVEADKAVDVVAKRIDNAMADGVQTQTIAEDFMGISRQMVYKLVRERVDKKPMGQKPSRNGDSGTS